MFFFYLKHSTYHKMWFSLSNCHWVHFFYVKCIFWIILDLQKRFTDSTGVCMPLIQFSASLQVNIGLSKPGNQTDTSLLSELHTLVGFHQCPH